MLQINSRVLPYLTRQQSSIVLPCLAAHWLCLESIYAPRKTELSSTLFTLVCSIKAFEQPCKYIHVFIFWWKSIRFIHYYWAVFTISSLSAHFNLCQIHYRLNVMKALLILTLLQPVISKNRVNIFQKKSLTWNPLFWRKDNGTMMEIFSGRIKCLRRRKCTF